MKGDATCGSRTGHKEKKVGKSREKPKGAKMPRKKQKKIEKCFPWP